jgi:hypothetical protein
VARARLNLGVFVDTLTIEDFVAFAGCLAWKGTRVLIDWIIWGSSIPLRIEVFGDGLYTFSKAGPDKSTTRTAATQACGSVRILDGFLDSQPAFSFPFAFAFFFLLLQTPFYSNCQAQSLDLTNLPFATIHIAWRWI